MILSCSSIKHVNVCRLFSQRHQPNVSPKNRPRYCSAFLPAAKLETLVLCPSKKKKIILFKLNARGKTRRNCALEKYTDMLSFAFKNTHTISECLEREVRGGEEEKERGSEGGKKGKGADFLILTQRALRHAISPNYEGREGRRGRGE